LAPGDLRERITGPELPERVGAALVKALREMERSMGG
jgi:hypothetical protein